jgi:hypothetical protein
MHQHQQRSKDQVGRFLVRGVRDFTIYATTSAGQWVRFSTEGDQAWKALPEDLQDTLGGSYIVGVSMLEQGRAYLEQVPDNETKDLTLNFGDS